MTPIVLRRTSSARCSGSNRISSKSKNQSSWWARDHQRTYCYPDDGQNELVGVLELNRDVTDREKECDHNPLESYQQQVLDDLQDKISRLAEGDLTIDPTVPEPDSDFEEMQTVYDEFTTMNQGVAEASDAVERQAESAEEVSSVVENTSALTQQITGSMQEVASGVDQQSTAMDEVAEMAQLLSQRSDTLQEKVAQFKVDADDTATLNN